MGSQTHSLSTIRNNRKSEIQDVGHQTTHLSLWKKTAKQSQRCALKLMELL